MKKFNLFIWHKKPNFHLKSHYKAELGFVEFGPASN